MTHHTTLLENNRRWVERLTAGDPDFFRRMETEHRPRFLYIGCSDARVPADLITQVAPGELFVHRNVANLVVPTDTNLMAVLHYAVAELGVSDVIVCGHEECGGVKAAMGTGPAPLMVEHWLANVRAVARMHAAELASLPCEDDRRRRMVELNVAEQVLTLSRTPQVREAWAAGRELRLHGWVYRLGRGMLSDLGITLDGPDAAARAAAKAA
jgi:carbonic anhydrase